MPNPCTTFYAGHRVSEVAGSFDHAIVTFAANAHTRWVRCTARVMSEDIESHIPCQCEHRDHFDTDVDGMPIFQRGHDYLDVPAGEARAMFVGEICDECASGHLAEYVED